MMKSRKRTVSACLQVDWTAVGKRLRELRGFEMTQQEFARRIGISQNYLSTMEHGKVEIGAEILLKISREFGKGLEWLLTGDDRERKLNS